jgi:hypothetical protein
VFLSPYIELVAILRFSFVFGCDFVIGLNALTLYGYLAKLNLEDRKSSKMGCLIHSNFITKPSSLD